MDGIKIQHFGRNRENSKISRWHSFVFEKNLRRGVIWSDKPLILSSSCISNNFLFPTLQSNDRQRCFSHKDTNEAGSSLNNVPKPIIAHDKGLLAWENHEKYLAPKPLAVPENFLFGLAQDSLYIALQRIRSARSLKPLRVLGGPPQEELWHK